MASSLLPCLLAMSAVAVAAVPTGDCDTDCHFFAPCTPLCQQWNCTNCGTGTTHSPPPSPPPPPPPPPPLTPPTFIELSPGVVTVGRDCGKACRGAVMDDPSDARLPVAPGWLS